MIYVFQAAFVVILVIAERYNSRWSKNKIENGLPYTSGLFFSARPLTGNKAIFMYRLNIIALRTTVVLLVISILIIDFIK